jgi:hypothetical protein
MSFASFPLEKLGLAPAQLAACQKGGFEIAPDEVVFRRFALITLLLCFTLRLHGRGRLVTRTRDRRRM